MSAHLKVLQIVAKKVLEHADIDGKPQFVEQLSARVAQLGKHRFDESPLQGS